MPEIIQMKQVKCRDGEILGTMKASRKISSDLFFSHLILSSAM